MTDTKARALANGILVLGGATLAYYVITTPPLRRLAWKVLKTAVRTTIPGYLLTEINRAWVESARAA
jgi:hypothetical protein